MLSLSDHIDADSRALVRSLERCEVAALDHAAHLQAAWACAVGRELPELLAEFPPLLQAYAASKGVPEYFHATITFAFLCMIHERVQRSPHKTWAAFAAEHAELFGERLLSDVYSEEVLSSPRARAQPLFPAGNAQRVG